MKMQNGPQILPVKQYDLLSVIYLCYKEQEITKKNLNSGNKKQVWHWPYEAPGIVDSGLYAITIVCGPKDMSQEKYILI